MIIQEKYVVPKGKALSTIRSFGPAGVLPKAGRQSSQGVRLLQTEGHRRTTEEMSNLGV